MWFASLFFVSRYLVQSIKVIQFLLFDNLSPKLFIFRLGSRGGHGHGSSCLFQLEQSCWRINALTVLKPRLQQSAYAFWSWEESRNFENSVQLLPWRRMAVIFHLSNLHLTVCSMLAKCISYLIMFTTKLQWTSPLSRLTVAIIIEQKGSIRHMVKTV